MENEQKNISGDVGDVIESRYKKCHTMVLCIKLLHYQIATYTVQLHTNAYVYQHTIFIVL